jgi:hypothetical protein
VLFVTKNAGVDLNSTSEYGVLMPGFGTREPGEREPECQRDLVAETERLVTIK